MQRMDEWPMDKQRRLIYAGVIDHENLIIIVSKERKTQLKCFRRVGSCAVFLLRI